MKIKLALLALVAMQTTVLAGGTYSCWTSTDGSGVLMCGTADNSHVATAEEIIQDRQYRWDTEKYIPHLADFGSNLEALIKTMPPLEAERVRATWPIVQSKAQEKVVVFLDAQQGGVAAPKK